MKIVIATAVYYPQINGVAVFSHNLATGLAKRGNEVIVVCPSQTGKSYTRSEDGVRVYYLKSVQAKVYPDQIHAVPKGRFKFFYKHGFRVSVFPAKEVKKIMDGFCPDVVHVQVSDPIGLSVVSYARKHNIPVVTTEHNQPEVLTESLKLPRILKKGVNVILTSYFRNRQNKSDFVTMPTEQAIRGLIGKGEEFKVLIAAVSNGVDLSCFGPGRMSDELYDKYDLEKGVPTVLYVGRIDPEKKVELVIKAFIEVRRKIPKIQLVIVGDGVDKARLERLYGLEPQVCFLGKILPPDLYEIYKVGWVFATASEIETQGIVLIEAAASGMPLIAVDKGAVSEICINGVNGYLCRPRAVDEMAKAMTEILSDEALRKKFSLASLRIAEEHNFEKTLDKFENIYCRVIKNQNEKKTC